MFVELRKQNALIKNCTLWVDILVCDTPFCDNSVFNYAGVGNQHINTISCHQRSRVLIVNGRSEVFLLLRACHHYIEQKHYNDYWRTIRFLHCIRYYFNQPAILRTNVR